MTDKTGATLEALTELLYALDWRDACEAAKVGHDKIVFANEKVRKAQHRARAIIEHEAARRCATPAKHS